MSTAPEPRRADTAGVYPRGQEEFARVASFSDGVFAIAMTLLVVGIEVPDLAPGESLASALGDQSRQIFSFFISFVVIGYYWLAHHRFFANLKLVDTTLIGWNLVYLAVIAFLPFPTALVGRYEPDAISVVIYAVALLVASGLESVMFARVHKVGALKHPIPDDVYRWVQIASTVPVIVFVASIPIAVYAGTTWALFSWLLIFPIERLISWRRPVDTARYFE